MGPNLPKRTDTGLPEAGSPKIRSPLSLSCPSLLLDEIDQNSFIITDQSTFPSAISSKSCSTLAVNYNLEYFQNSLPRNQ
jgi:hypothetical protein